MSDPSERTVATGGRGPQAGQRGEGGIELDIVRLALVDDGGPFGHDVEALMDGASAGAVIVVGRTANMHVYPSEVVAPRYLFWSSLFWAGLFLVWIEHSDSWRRARWLVFPMALALPILIFPQLAAASGHCVLPGSLLPSLVGTAVTRRPELLESLTPEDRQLWRMVADGVETMQIAETLFVSERTAKRMVALLLRRLGVANRIQAAALAGQSGLLDAVPS